MIPLDVQEARDLLQRFEHLEFIRMHRLVSLAERIIRKNVLEALEALVQDRDGTFDDGAVFEGVDITGMHLLDAFAGFRARAVARHTLAVHRLLLRRAGPHARSVVLQKMFRTSSHASRTVSVFPLGICFPGVRGWIVPEGIVNIQTSICVFLGFTK